jgi:hypothetical protein
VDNHLSVILGFMVIQISGGGEKALDGVVKILNAGERSTRSSGISPQHAPHAPSQRFSPTDAFQECLVTPATTWEDGVVWRCRHPFPRSF